jgi:hypothetical protein
MIPDSVVASPTAVTRTRSEPPATTVPAATRSPGSLATGRDSPVIIDSSTSARAALDLAVDRHPAARPDQHDVARAQRGQRHVLGARFVARVRQPLGVSGSSSASALSAPRAWAIERISSQWPSSMIVISVESSHQISTSSSPAVPATLATKATRWPG